MFDDCPPMLTIVIMVIIAFSLWDKFYGGLPKPNE